MTIRVNENIRGDSPMDWQVRQVILPSPLSLTETNPELVFVENKSGLVFIVTNPELVFVENKSGLVFMVTKPELVFVEN